MANQGPSEGCLDACTRADRHAFVQVGWQSEAYRFAKKKGSWLPVVEHRKPVPPTEIGSFSFDFSKGNLQTVAVDSDIVVDHVRFQVCIHL